MRNFAGKYPALETLEQLPVHFTPGALVEIRRLIASHKDAMLRVGVKGGGCAGMSYILDFDNPGPQDEHYDMEGIPVLMNRAHGIYLTGMEVDYEQGLNARGFTFTNPNAGTTCGCGTSFSVK